MNILFTLPESQKIWTTQKNSEDCVVSFFSFDTEEKICFEGMVVEADEQYFEAFNSKKYRSFKKDENEPEYLQRLNKTIQIIRENGLKKLVISRRKNIDFEAVDLQKSYENLRQSYPSALVYLLDTGKGLWIGAFSELLGKFKKDNQEFETMSLAGTLPLNAEWSQKEIREQQAVSDYIGSILQQYSDEVHISETHDHISGNLKHLKTDFKAKIDQEFLEKLIDELHPTPAVCGFPKEFCKSAIQNTEKFPRELYAGYSRIEFENYIYYFVTLRCAKIYSDHAELFVGGGITALSDPQKEWQETELKAEAIGRNLVFT